MCAFDRGPTPAHANQILYYKSLSLEGNEGIYLAEEGSETDGTFVSGLTMGEVVYDIRWLPDASGFLFSKSDASVYYGASNIYEYNFGSKATTQLTHFTTQFALGLSTSPDGTTVAFSVANEDPVTGATTARNIWIMPRNGSAPPSIFIKNATGPSWTRTSPPGP
jgi:Tol biopolymer transport system component